MKYRYLLVDEDGDVFGTNDQEAVEECTQEGSPYIAVDCETGTYFMGGPIEELLVLEKSYEPSPEDRALDPDDDIPF